MTIISSVRLPHGIDGTTARRLRGNHRLQVSLDGEHLAALHPHTDQRVTLIFHSTSQRWNNLAIKDPRLIHVSENNALVTGHDPSSPNSSRRNYLVDPCGRIIGSDSVRKPGKNRLRSQWYTKAGVERFMISCLGLPTEIYRDDIHDWWMRNEDVFQLIPGDVNLAQNSPDKQAYILLVEPPQHSNETRLPFRRLLLMRATDPPTVISDQPMVENFCSGHFHLISTIWTEPGGHLALLIDREVEDEYSYDEHVYRRQMILPGKQVVPVPSGHKIDEILLTEKGELVAFISRAPKNGENFLHDSEGETIITAPEIWNLTRNPENQGFCYNLIDGGSVCKISLDNAKPNLT